MSTAASSIPEERPLPSASELWRSTLTLIRRHGLLLLGYAGWLFIPLALHILLRVTFGDNETGMLLDSAVSVLSLALSAWSFAALALASRSLLLQPDKPHEARHAALHTGNLAKLIVTLLLALIAALLGLILIVPGIVFAVWFTFAGLVTVFEGTWNFPALARSRELSRGRFWPVIGRIIACDGLLAVFLFVLLLITCLGTGIDPAYISLGSPLPLPIDIVFAVTQILVLPVVMLYHVILYQSLRKG